MTQTLLKTIADFNTTLTSGVAVGATTATLTSATDDDGVVLPTGTYALTIDRKNSSKEFIECTLTGTSLTNVKTLARGTSTGTSGFAKAHRKGAEVIISDFAAIKRITNVLDGTTDLDSGTPLSYDGVASLTPASNELATVAYVDAVSIAGAADATTSTKGIGRVSVAPVSAATPIFVGDNDPRVPTTGENDALAGTSGTPSSSNKYVTADDVSDAGVTGKVVRLSGTNYPAGNGSNLTNLPDLTGIASGENITAGQPVFINPSDSTVYKAHGYKQIDTASMTLSTTTIGRIAKLSDSQYVYLYHNGTTTLSVAVATRSTGVNVDTETVTTSYDQTRAASTTLPQSTVCRLSDTTFIVIYAKTTNNDLYFRTGSISGSTITMDTETVYPGPFDYCFGFSSVPGASDGKVVFTYFDTTTADGTAGTITPKLAYLTVTTNSVTVTYGISGATITTGGYSSDIVWTQAAFTQGIAYGVFCTVNSGNVKQVRINTIEVNSGGTTADNLVPNLESQTGAGVSSGYTQYIPSVVGHDGKIYFGWATNNGGAPYVNTKTVLEASQSGARIFYQTSTVKLGGDTTVSALSMVGNEMGVVVFGFADADNSLRVNLYIQKDKIYEFYDYTLLGLSSSNPTPALWYSNLKDEVVLALDGTYIKTWRLPTPVDGIAYASVTSPTAPVIFSNQVTTSGLTSGARYFLKDTYTTTGDMDFKGIIPVGRALSTTVMLLK
jgi:hypothetical protein